ncbi:carbon starvation CstA family protein [Bradyrhizobium sp.]|uniref:carbon starvation CstA family protein n=1 Tax=Bradyrhizobium sp. TaxID=376 RepID=UPI003C7356F9
MNSFWIVVLSVVTTYLAYNLYAKRIDRNVIQPDAKRATPARMYMDGVDFMPTSRNVLFGYHFKAIAAAGPIVGPITAANLWGWAPSLAWLILGVSFIGWASDYSAIMVAVRNDGNSLSAIAHRLIAPRTRTILFVFIFFYLMLLAGAFVGILAAILSARPDVPFGIVMLGLMGLLAGQMMYRWKMGITAVTVLVVAVTLGAMAIGPMGQHRDAAGALMQGPVAAAVTWVNDKVDSVTGHQPVFTVVDPTLADPRIPAPRVDGTRPTTPAYDAVTGALKTLPNYLFWMVFLFAFSYLGANLPIWRYAQPVAYIGFWIMLITILLSAAGMVVAPLLGTKDAAGNLIGAFALPAFKDFGFAIEADKAWQPLWPMLFVTIACGAISGWHSLVGSIGTARQLEYETDGLPVGAGSMFGENALALLSLTAVSIAGVGGGGGRFALGVGKLVYAGSFGLIPEIFGTALGFGTFVIIVLTVTVLVFRVMRVTLTEWIGDTIPLVRNMHVSSIISMVLTAALVLTGTWVYLWQMFGASNQLMAALSLLVVSVWLKSENRNPTYALLPMIFMYVTTLAATVVTARNLYVTIAANPKMSGLPVAGAWAMIVVSALLFVAALVIGWDGYKAYLRYRAHHAARALHPAE